LAATLLATAASGLITATAMLALLTTCRSTRLPATWSATPKTPSLKTKFVIVRNTYFLDDLILIFF
jgi:hypothetical protein